MKKNTITTLALIAAFSMAASSVEAQISRPKDYEKSIEVAEKEEVIDKEQEEFLDRGTKEDDVVELPQPEEQNITIDYLAPLGSGILLLSCLGGAYLLGKKRKE